MLMNLPGAVRRPPIESTSPFRADIIHYGETYKHILQYLEEILAGSVPEFCAVKPLLSVHFSRERFMQVLEASGKFMSVRSDALGMSMHREKFAEFSRELDPELARYIRASIDSITLPQEHEMHVRGRHPVRQWVLCTGLLEFRRLIGNLVAHTTGHVYWEAPSSTKFIPKVPPLTASGRYYLSRISNVLAMYRYIIRNKLHLEHHGSTLFWAAVITSQPLNKDWKTVTDGELWSDFFAALRDELDVELKYEPTTVALYLPGVPPGRDEGGTKMAITAETMQETINSPVKVMGIHIRPYFDGNPGVYSLVVAAYAKPALLARDSVFAEAKTLAESRVTYKLDTITRYSCFGKFGAKQTHIWAVPITNVSKSEVFPCKAGAITIQDRYYLPYLSGISGKDTLRHYLFPATMRSYLALLAIYGLKAPSKLCRLNPEVDGLLNIESPSFGATLSWLVPRLMHVGYADIRAYIQCLGTERGETVAPRDELFHDFVTRVEF